MFKTQQFNTPPGVRPRKLSELETRYCPAFLTALLDIARARVKRDQWGGPFNNQARRQQIFRDLHHALSFDRIIETGTLRGTTTDFFSRETRARVYSVEIVPVHHYYARYRLLLSWRVHLQCGDSLSYLRQLSGRRQLAGATFFYLDAHTGDAIPLRDEVDFIFEHAESPVIMIDDFQVPDDPGYGFNQRTHDNLDLTYLRLSESPDRMAFFPRARAVEESGARRGCVVLARSGVVADRIGRVPSLRPWPLGDGTR